MSATSLEENRHRSRTVPGRETCERCWRPAAACYCGHVTPIETRTRLVLLQHPRERTVAIGTARMASLCLVNSELHVGIDWSRSAPLARALSDPERPPVLLYPGEGARDIVRDPPPGPVTLVVVDGTWAQTKKVVRINPVLASLPRYAFVPASPSEYRIRKEPDDVSVATIEALVHALGALEGAHGDERRFEALLAPFRAMIDYQIECEERFRGARVRHAKHRARVRRMRIPRALSERLEHVVCVAGEANAQPYTARAADPGYADELIHWAAYRPATGEAMSFVIAPTRPLATGTSIHTRLDEETLRRGGTLPECLAAWNAFRREGDILCSWGRYETGLFAASGGALPEEHVDLRRIAREVSKGTAGALTDYRARLPAVEPPLVVPPFPEELVPGRAGKKLAAITEIVATYATLSRSGR